MELYRFLLLETTFRGERIAVSLRSGSSLMTLGVARLKGKSLQSTSAFSLITFVRALALLLPIRDTSYPNLLIQSTLYTSMMTTPGLAALKRIALTNTVLFSQPYLPVGAVNCGEVRK
jgi:hypothetical protein